MEKVPFKQKLKNGWKWTRANLLNKETLFFAILGELIFWSPAIVCVILALVVDAKFWAVAGSIAAFWTLPLTPGWAIQIALIFALKKLFHKVFLRKQQARQEKKANKALQKGQDGGCEQCQTQTDEQSTEVQTEGKTDQQTTN